MLTKAQAHIAVLSDIHVDMLFEISAGFELLDIYSDTHNLTFYELYLAYIATFSPVSSNIAYLVVVA